MHALVKTGREVEADPLLTPFFGAATEGERNAIVERLLVEHAGPCIDRVLDSRYRQSSLSPSHRDDLRAEIVLRLVNRLHALAHDEGAAPIVSFEDYVAVVAFNAFDLFLRRAHPQRSQLKSRIRYALRHDVRLAEWESGGEPVGGLAAWKPRSDALRNVDAPAAPARDLRELLVSLFAQARRPVVLNAIVAAVTEVQGDDRAQAAADHVTHPKFEDDLANAEFLRQVWSEIGELPPKQRAALLLHARDAAGESVIRLLPLAGIASARQIGGTLEIDPHRLAELWSKLPLDDARIAAILEVTRQQVINLRQAARHRLTRRLRHEPGKGSRRS